MAPKAARVPGKTILEVAAQVGWGMVYFYDMDDLEVKSSNGVHTGVSLSLLWLTSPTFGIGLGGTFHYVQAGESVMGGAATLHFLFGDIETKRYVFLFDIGGGWIFCTRAGVYVSNKAHTGGFTAKLGYYYQRATSFNVDSFGIDVKAHNHNTEF